MSTGREILIRQRVADPDWARRRLHYELYVVAPLQRRALLEISVQLALDEIHAMVAAARRRIDRMYLDALIDRDVKLPPELVETAKQDGDQFYAEDDWFWRAARMWW